MKIDIGTILPSNPNYAGSPEQLAKKAEWDKIQKESPNAGFSFTFDPAGPPHSDDIQRKSRKSAQNLSRSLVQTAPKTALTAQN